MVVASGQILSAARLNGLVSGFQTQIDAKLTGLIKVKTADTARASTTTYTDDAHLVAAVEANATYTWEIQGSYQAPVTPLIKFQAVFPSGTCRCVTWRYAPNTTAGADIWQVNPTSGAVSSASPAAIVAGLTGHATNNWPFRFTGSLHVGVTAGNFALQWAQQVSNASATTLRQGTWLQLIKTN